MTDGRERTLFAAIVAVMATQLVEIWNDQAASNGKPMSTKERLAQLTGNRK